MINTDALQALFDKLPQEVVPGCDCEIRRDGQTVFRSRHGWADYEKTRPVDGSELYRIYSCTKVVTAVGIMRLVEQGKLGLYDLVEKYLPEYAHVMLGGAPKTAAAAGGYDPTAQVYRGAGQPDAPRVPEHKMRIYDLIRMASGMSYDMTSAPMQVMFSDPAVDTRRGAALMAQVPLQFEPGTDFLYSLSHNVLGAVAEVVSGLSYDIFLENEIFRPLGMNHTGFEPRETDGYQLAAQYMMNDDQKTYYPISGNAYVPNPGYFCGGSGLISCVDDLIVFADVLAGGGTAGSGYRLLKPETIDLMRQDHLSPAMRASMHRNWPHLINYSYGLGVRTFVENADGNGGAPGEFGWEGAAGSYLLIDPENRISCVYTQHVRKCSLAVQYIHRKITKAIYAE